MNIDKYPIYYPYGATTPPYSPSKPHRGNDIALVYQPVIINGTQIGVSGATGKVDGPHVHVQAGRDEWAQQTIDSKPYIGKPGTVVKTGTGSEWGNYVCIKVGDVYVYYCHLSQINVKVGQEIGGEETMDRGAIINRYRLLFNREPSEAEIKNWLGRPYKDVDDAIFASKEIHDRMDKANGYDFALSVANARGDRLNAIAKLLGAKDGDDVATIFNNIDQLEKGASDIDKENNKILKEILDKIK